MDSFQHFVQDTEFPKDIKPNLEIKDEPIDMESSLMEQPIRNERIFEDFEVYNKQVHIQNFSNTLEAAMIWSNLRDFYNFYPTSEDIIDIENESPNDEKSNMFENFENSNDFDNFLSVNMTGKDQEITDEINPKGQLNSK